MDASKQFKSKQRIVDVNVKTVDTRAHLPVYLVLDYTRNPVKFAQWLSKNKIYNLYSVKTKKGWFVFSCLKQHFNRPPQIGMFIRCNRHKKMFEITGRKGR